MPVPGPDVSPDGADVSTVVPGQLIDAAWGSSVSADLAELWSVVRSGSGGGLEAATTAETIAGTLTTKAVTPASMAAATSEFDVRNYGAVGDDVANDTAAIQAALSAAGAVKGTVLVPAGTYRHDGITVPDFVTMEGVGHQGSTLNYVGTGVAVTLGNQATLRTLKVSRSGAVGTSTGIGFIPDVGRMVLDRCLVQLFDTGVNVASAIILTLRECVIEFNVTNGIRFSGQTNNVQVRGGEIKGSVNGALVAGGNNIVFDGVAIEGNTAYGIRVTGATPYVHNMVVTGCYFEENGTYDISVDGSGNAFSFLNTFFLGTPTSIRLFSGFDMRVEGNWFNPGGATPKALTLDQYCERTYVGPNNYLAGAFDPNVDDDGVGTRVIGQTDVTLSFPNQTILSDTTVWGAHVYTATRKVKVVAARLVSSTTLNVNASNHWKVLLQKYNSAGAFQGSVCFFGSDTQALTASVPVTVPVDPSFSTLVAGDTLALSWNKTGTPATLNYPSLSLRVLEGGP